MAHVENATQATMTHMLVVRTRQSWGGTRTAYMGMYTPGKALIVAGRLARDGYGYILRPVKVS